MSSIFLKLRTWWETADRTQKVVSLFGCAFLLAILGATFFFASRPKYELLYAGLTQKDMGMVTEELGKAGIPNRYDVRGNVEVPSDRKPEAQAVLARANALPSSGHGGYADFEKMGWMNTPSVERERIKAAIEGELAKSVEQVQGVASARVHITPGDDSRFMSDRKPPTASIFVTQDGQGGIGPEEARAIARLVANAVPKLNMKHIAVISNEGLTLWDGQTEQGADGRAAGKVQAEIQESKRREQEIQQKLDAVLGRGNAVVSVDLTMDFDQTSQTETIVTPSDGPISFEQTKEQMGPGEAGGAGADTFGSNTTGGSPAGPGEGGAKAGYTSEQTAKQFDRNVTRRNTEKAVGTIKTMSINVLVNKSKVEDVGPVNEFLDGYLGPNLDQPGFKASVTSLEFDTTTAKKSEEASAAVASQARLQQLISILPIAALLLVGFMVVKAIGKAVKPNVMVAAMPDGTMMPVGMGGANAGAPALAPGTTRVVGPDGREMVQVAGGPLLDPETGEPIESIAERVDVPLEQIKKMSQERPDVVAMLLKSWLLEERR